MKSDEGTMTEQELREAEVPWPRNKQELMDYIDCLVEREHDYGTCCYAMSMCALATFRYVSSKLGTTGFQASCADLDFLKRSRLMKNGFCIVDYQNLMYPQYKNKIPGFWEHIRINKKHLSDLANEMLKERENVHPDVMEHWEYIASLSQDG